MPKSQQATPEPSIAHCEGRRARHAGVKLENSALRKLRVGSRQYDDFIAGYDSAEKSA